MIELAPSSKMGLTIASPFILGSGAVGWGNAWPAGLEPGWFGAWVTPPLTLQSRRGATGPRLAEIPGGFILNTGDHNPGLRRVLRDGLAQWDGLRRPVIVALSAATPEDWPRLGERLDDIGVSGVEAHLPAGATPREAAGWIANLVRSCQLPVIVKVAAINAAPQAEACTAAGADVLVVATPPGGAAAAPEGSLVEGSVAGPAAFPFTLHALLAVTELGLGLPLIAAGGITLAQDVAECWQHGATAVQLRSILWTAPDAVAGLMADAQRTMPSANARA